MPHTRYFRTNHRQVKHLLKTSLLSALTLSLLACQFGQSMSSPGGQNNPGNPSTGIHTLAAPTAAELSQFQSSPLVKAINQFSLDFFQTLAQENSGNQITSPLSAAMALSMTYNGASGTTAEAMAKTLKLPDLSLEELNQLYLILRKQLAHADPEATLALANGLWSKQGLSFDPLFLERSRHSFGAEVEEVDFTAAETVQQINQWVTAQTQGKITELIKSDDFSPLTILVLINAIYFKGLWTHPFKAENTLDAPFSTAKGTIQNVPTMHLSEKLPYLQGPDFQAVALPYGKENTEQNLRMYLFRPNDSLSMHDWLQGFNSSDLEGWLQDFREQQGSLALPRFQSEFELELKELLSQLGMGIAFDANQANFSGLLPEGHDAYISKVRQKAFIEVNEAGTEAAAATSVQVDLRAAPLEQPFDLKFDRPFFYLIREEQTGTLLFMGRVESF